MKELHRKGLANNPGPESCVYNRKAVDEALTGEYAGQPLSCEIQTSREPTLLSEHVRNQEVGQMHSTRERVEQRAEKPHGDSGGKASDQGKRDANSRGPDAEPDPHVAWITTRA